MSDFVGDESIDDYNVSISQSLLSLSDPIDELVET